MNRNVNKNIKKTLAKNHAAYVLITCDEPTENGEMNVEMTYEGDVDVAAFLIHGAQDFIDKQENPECSCEIHPLKQNDQAS